MPLAIEPILEHLGLAHEPPSVAALDRLLAAWAERIPWESASRIALHQDPGAPADYARLPERFFADARRWGSGGTCFESNLALRALLEALGFQVTLHFCDMGEQRDPHCAALVELEDAVYLADAGYPVAAALPLDPDAPTERETPAAIFRAIPQAGGRWEIRRMGRNGYDDQAFVLKRAPVDAGTFHARLLRDHEPDGFFLDEVILSRTGPDGMLRYSEGKGLVRRTPDGESEVALSANESADLPRTLARLFDYEEDVLRRALARINLPPFPASEGQTGAP